MPKELRPPFVQVATPFQDAVVRYLRYGFAHLPPSIARIFLSKEVVLPFHRFRMLRNGFFKYPLRWREIKEVLRNRGEGTPLILTVWIPGSVDSTG